jgi:multicomponent K+:H+ antiporter subunit E
MRRLLPASLLSLALLACWLGLNNSLSPGHLLLGSLLALLIPLLVTALAPDQDRGHRPPRVAPLLSFLGLVVWDIVLANLRVAVLILGPRSRIRSGFVTVPLSLQRPVSVHVLASVITLTPGTVTVAVSPDRRSLLVHYLSSDDPASLVRNIRDRYERRIGEIFEP